MKWTWIQNEIQYIFFFNSLFIIFMLQCISNTTSVYWFMSRISLIRDTMSLNKKDFNIMCNAEYFLLKVIVISSLWHFRFYWDLWKFPRELRVNLRKSRNPLKIYYMCASYNCFISLKKCPHSLAFARF